MASRRAATRGAAANAVTGRAAQVAAPRSRGRVRPEGAAFPVPPPASELPSDYPAVLADLKARIAAARTRAALAVSRELIALYWHVGQTLVARQGGAGWGDGVVERLAHDVQTAFPGLKGFSARNVWRMRAFFLAWSTTARKLPRAVAESARVGRAKKLPQPVAETAAGGVAGPPEAVALLPWGHNIALMEKLSSRDERLWYARQAVAMGWSRAALLDQIEKKAQARQGQATTNFARALPADRSDLARETLKDPYVFDFLTCGAEAHERVTERELLTHIREFLLELGAGFAFMGSQVKLTVGGDDYYLDLLFYHVRLRCHVVVELKATAFKPEHAGKLNFYLSAVDDLLRHPDDRPSIGLLLCRSHNKVQVEYALRDVAKPIGVAQWETRLVESLPEELKGSLPTVEEIEAELARDGSSP